MSESQIVKAFTSRKARNFDDDQSNDDEEGSDYKQSESGGDAKYVDTAGVTQTAQANPSFRNYSGVFKNLVKANNIVTMYPIISMIITYDSTKAVTVTKKSDEEYYVKQYDLEKYDMTFEEKIGGEPGQYIKLKEVEQDPLGTQFAIAYCDDGKFFVRTFGKDSRTEDEIKKNELDVNKLLGINDYTMCNQSFPDPFITCCFVGTDRLFVNLFHNYDLKHYHFLYDLKTQKIIGSHEERVIECTKKNFPYKCFYNDDKEEIYSFYRQGQSFIIKSDNMMDYTFDRMTEMDLG